MRDVESNVKQMRTTRMREKEREERGRGGERERESAPQTPRKKRKEIKKKEEKKEKEEKEEKGTMMCERSVEREAWSVQYCRTGGCAHTHTQSTKLKQKN